jgi:hypothetical protein
MTKPQLRVHLSKKVFVSRDFSREYLNLMIFNDGTTTLFPNSLVSDYKLSQKEINEFPLSEPYLQEIIEKILQRSGLAGTEWPFVINKGDLLSLLMGLDSDDRLLVRKLFQGEIDTEVLAKNVERMWPDIFSNEGTWSWLLKPAAANWIKRNTPNDPFSLLGFKKLINETNKNGDLKESIKNS